MGFSKILFPPISRIGWGALETLVLEVEKFMPGKVLIVTDPMLVQLGLTERISAPLMEKGFEVSLFTEVVPEPSLELGEKLVSFTRKNEFDLIIGLGGGSAMDLAKLAAVLAVHEGPVAQYLNLSGTMKIHYRGLPKILIPTTSGTGSEVTNISVLSLETTKDVVAHDYLVADVAIVDPALTISLPPKVTAATGIDALTHAVEAYVSLNSNPISDPLALQAIRLITRSLRKAVNDGEDREARTDMSNGSYLAGLAFSNAGVAAVHALAYPIGGQYHIAHGESNAVLLPYVMSYIRKSCEKRMAEIFEALGGNRKNDSDEEASIKCVQELRQIVKDVGISSTLGGFSIPESALEHLTSDAVKQKRILARSPMALLEPDIRNIYQSAFYGILTEKD
ncbi:iron-containing alcohol dehydrogenase [Sporosarcina jiandibaonis]|uniref:iron-containing alcohol dehydrogenase n=1 Tax=Sporosarcina jiandibaonis TaxID=2715535 RepID=UPI0015574F63|nr:iron-containing alcohol dehydrogenase [Sporosarcina jiandibaonis]